MRGEPAQECCPGAHREPGTEALGQISEDMCPRGEGSPGMLSQEFCPRTSVPGQTSQDELPRTNFLSACGLLKCGNLFEAPIGGSILGPM